jgi:hypothetical protein
VDDLGDLAGHPQRDLGLEAEPRRRDVPGQCLHAPSPRPHGSERARERLAQPLAGVLVVARPDQDEHAAIGELQVAREQLDPDAARRARQQDAVALRRDRRVLAAPRRRRDHAEQARASSSSIASSIPRAMRSASSASDACA